MISLRDVVMFTIKVNGRSGPRGVGRCCLFAVHGDEFLEVLDTVLGELGRGVVVDASEDVGDVGSIGVQLNYRRA